MGNSTTHRLSSVRPTEVNTMMINGVMVIIANNKGVSLYSLDKIKQIGLTDYAWKFNKGATVPQELKIVSDKPEHYMLAPTVNMPVDKYKGLLEEMGIKCSKYFKVKPGGIVTRA